MSDVNKESIYDEQISPLVTQIIEVCEKAGIAMLMQFALPTPEDPDLLCTTLLPDGEGKNRPEHLKAMKIIGPSDPTPIRSGVITVKDRDGKVVSSTVILEGRAQPFEEVLVISADQHVACPKRPPFLRAR